MLSADHQVQSRDHQPSVPEALVNDWVEVSDVTDFEPFDDCET
jgi:hypothetical protein